jgi:hypothetical protein
VRAAPLGILIQRIVSDRRVPVGRVPFGLKDTGRLGIRWNLLVNGHQLYRGRLDHSADVRPPSQPDRPSTTCGHHDPAMTAIGRDEARQYSAITPG